MLVWNRGGDDTIRSYRSNTDYKLLSRIPKTRLDCELRGHHVLSDGQKCSNSERNIFQVTLALNDRIAILRLRQHCRVRKFTSFDLQKAFDRVMHSAKNDGNQRSGFVKVSRYISSC